MKSNVLHFAKAIILIITVIVFSVNSGKGQGVNWKIEGNNNINENTNFIGTTNYASFSIRTNNVNRFNITKDGKVNILGDCYIKGKLNGDSIKISGYVTVDSMNVRSLKIGDHSLWLGGTWTSSTGTYQDYIQSNNGVINIGNLNLTNFSNIQVGIGSQAPQSQLHLHKDGSNALYEQWTNGVTGSATSNHGFKIGVAGNGNAQIIQNYNAPIQFFSNYSSYFTNSPLQEIMRITSGNTGIAFDACGIYQGLRIFTAGITGGPNCGQLNAEGQLDLWVSGANSGNIRWNGSGLIRGCNNRFEIYGNLGGIYLNARNSTGQNNIPQNQFFPNIQFDITSVQDIITIPNSNPLPSPSAYNVGIFAYDGDQDGLFDGNLGINTLHPRRRVEIMQSDAPQLRLSRSTGFLGKFTDFETTQAGNLRINPNDAMMYPLNGRVGINLAAGLEPQNALEVTSGPTSPTRSGLRFTNLNATLPVDAIANSSNTVLSVNDNGDVILVDAPLTSTGLGTCNPLLPTTFAAGSHGAIDLQNINNFHFLGNGAQEIDLIKMGYPCDYSVPAKLSVLQFGWTTNSSNAIKLFMAGDFWASSNSGSALTVGVRGRATGAQGQNIGVWGFVPNTFVNNPNLFPTSDLAGYFQGDVWMSSTTTSTGYVIPSDSILKTNISSFNNGCNVIRNINPVFYNYNGKAGFDKTRQYIGVIAEDLQQIAPFALDTIYAFLDTTDSEPTALLAVNNDAIMYTAINAIKELDAEVSTLKETLPPGHVALISPANGAVAVPVTATFTWHKAERADAYQFNLWSKDLPYNTQQILTDTFITVTLPFYCTEYTWMVMTSNINGVNLSSNYTFKTETSDMPDAPTIVSPSNGATYIPLANVFTWNTSEKAENYILFISTSESYDDVVNVVTTTDTFATASVPFCNTQYYWGVMAENCGSKSDVSEIRSFTTYIPYVAAPAIITPANGDTITEGSPVNWDIVEGATYYKISVSTSADEADVIYNYVVYPLWMPVYASGLKEGLYYWWVTACNNCNACSDKSEIRSFYYVEPVKTKDPLLSDNIFKTNITPITDALDKVLQLNGKYFKWDLVNYPELKDSTQQIGLIAQEVLPIVPEVISVNVQGRYSVDYDRLVAVLIEATKEQQTQINTLSDELEALKTSVSNCCDSMSTKNMVQQEQNNEVLNVINVELINKAAILYQNMPNPFGDGTTIRYFIPVEVKNAAIVFHNEFGQELKTVEISEKGMGQINLGTANLTSGIYTYSLLVDGKLVETKRMMKVE